MILISCLVVVVIISLSSGYTIRPIPSFSKATRLCVQKSSNYPTDAELENIKLDVSKLSPAERERIAFINKLDKEAEQFAESAGFRANPDDVPDPIEKTVLETEWSGQSGLEVSYLTTNTWKDIANRFDLAVGDLMTLFSFAVVGRLSHSESLDPISLFVTAAPFLFSWLLISPLLGAYSREATASRGSIPLKLLPAWAVSIPAAIATRGFINGYTPPTTFIIVSMTVTLITLFIWRNIYVSLFGTTSDKETRDAGFFEIFKMIGTLIRRW